jgi:shikimate dehydrogenase
MYPNVHTAAVDIDRFDCLEGVIDAVYNPLTTRLVREARAKGISAENGLYMLVAQAVLSAELFTDCPVEKDATDRIYRDLYTGMNNIVLTGMPGSGKSTLGRILAEKLGRELIETDEEIIRKTGMPIPEIFRKYGEAYFRDIESEVILQASMHGGRVISTGGGAVLRSSNVDAMKMNGTVVFLDRPVSALLPTDDRPLANNKDKILKLYNERYPVYKAAADITIEVCGTEEETAEEIRRALY